jgi:hypothetical protein
MQQVYDKMSKHKQICKSCGEFKNHHAKEMCKKCYNAYQYESGPKDYCKECGEFRVIKTRGLCHRCSNAEYRKCRPIHICKRCGKLKPMYLKDLCSVCYAKQRRKQNPEKTRMEHEKANRKLGILPMAENKTCSMFLGCHVAERVLSKVFKNTKVMPPNNPGYDFICNHDKKIDVKSSCMQKSENPRRSPNWAFRIDKNTIPDYFLCITFDNRESLTPLYLWLIPGHVLNLKTSTRISEITFPKWNQYALPIDKVVTCCDTLKIV